MGSEWVFEYMCQVLQSPTWEVPVMSYIDSTCAIFDNDEENKLSHTDAHMEFKELVETLLTQHLVDVGITADEFYEACEVAYRRNDNGDFATRIIEQLIACDDFNTFKAIMFKRNKELEAEALASLGKDLDAEVDELSQAKQLSARESKEREDAENDEIENLEAALRASEETERLKELSLLEKEQADIEAAIALSLALEGERIKLLEEQAYSPSDESKNGDESKESKVEDESKSGSPEQGLKSHNISQATVVEQRENLEDFRKSAAHVLDRGSSLRCMGGTTEYDDADVARRKRHIEAQRKKLLARKQKERQDQLQDYNAKKQRENGGSSAKPKLSSSTIQQQTSSGNGQLTHALARRMKQDLLEGGDNGDNFVSLDAKLRQVEQLRKERACLMRAAK